MSAVSFYILSTLRWLNSRSLQLWQVPNFNKTFILITHYIRKQLQVKIDQIIDEGRMRVRTSKKEWPQIALTQFEATLAKSL